MKYNLQPLTLAEAQTFVDEHHRHNAAPQGHKYSIGLSYGGKVIGVVIIGRPVARHNQDGWTLEVTRCCILEDYKNACSKLYAAAWRAARAMGYNRLITYTLKSESGGSLRASGPEDNRRNSGPEEWLEHPIKTASDGSPVSNRAEVDMGDKLIHLFSW